MNVLFLALSKFPNYSKNGKRYELTMNRYQVEGEKIIVSGQYQLEPIPLLLKEKKEKLDKVILLSTNETDKECDVYYTDDDKTETISPAKYFIRWICRNLGLTENDCKIISLEDNATTKYNATAKALKESAELLRDWSEHESVDLFVDTHGGFRSTQLIVEAILKLLGGDRLTLHVYNVKFNSGGNSIIEHDKAIEIFDFASGMNEFFNYGRIDSLEKFLDGDEEPIMDALRKISEGIRWCRIAVFNDGIRDLNAYFVQNNHPENPYLEIFEEQIQQDFKDLIERPDDSVPVIRWCVKKGFYQQALTFIEAKTPQVILDKNFIVLSDDFKSFAWGQEKNCRKKESEIYHSAFKKLATTIITNEEKEKIWRSDAGVFNAIFCNKDIFNSDKLDVRKCTRSISDKTKISSANVGKYLEKADTITVDGFKGHPLDIPDKMNINIYMLLLLYKTLKDQRNVSNHASDNNYCIDAVKNAIIYYLELLERIGGNK